MGKRKHTQAAEPKAQVNDLIIRQTWTKDMELTTKEEGAQILYDEPTHILDPRNEKTLPPRFVVLYPVLDDNGNKFLLIKCLEPPGETRSGRLLRPSSGKIRIPLALKYTLLI